jgi:uncharacterized protein (TIGR03435 family)
MPEGRTHGAMLSDYWMFQGRRVKEVLSELAGLPESRIEMPVTIDPDARFDMTLVPPSEQSPDTMRRLMTDGIGRHFGVEIERDVRETDVHVLSAPDGLPVTRDHGGGLGAMTFDLVEETGEHFRDRFHALSGRKLGGFGPMKKLSMSGDVSTDQLCRILEGMLGRPVIDDSGAGHGSFEMEFATDKGTEGLLAALRDKFGLAVTPERRPVEWLVVKPRTA